jgi:hypothetical protein
MCKNCVPDSAGLQMFQHFCDVSHGTSCARGAAWLRHRWSISRGSLCGTSCTRWSATTTRRSAPRLRASAMAKGCLGSSRMNSGRSCAAAVWRAAFARRAQASHAEALAEAGGFARFRCGDCGLDRFVPFSCKGRAVCASCGPSTMLRAVPSKVEGRRAPDGGTRRAPGGPRVPAGAGAAVGADAAASASVSAGVGSRPVSRGGPSTWLRAIPSKVEGWLSSSGSGGR